MSTLFSEQLDRALDDVNMSHAHYDAINSCVDSILEFKNKIKTVEKELIEHVDKLCADLSTEVRRLQPNLTVAIRTGACDICYRTKILNCNIKAYDGCWDFDNNDFGRLFSKKYPQCKKLSCDIYELASSIVEFFNNHYRSLA